MDDDEIDDMVAQMKLDIPKIKPDDIDEWNSVIADLESLKLDYEADRAKSLAYYKSRATSMFLRRTEASDAPKGSETEAPEGLAPEAVSPQKGGSSASRTMYANLGLLGVIIVSSVLSSLRQ